MQDQPQGMERRMAHRFLMLWRAAQKSDPVPTLSSVLIQDVGDIETAIWVLDMNNGQEPIFERIGTDYSAEGSCDLVGQSVSNVPENTLLGQAVHYYERVQMKRIPITLGSEFVNAAGETILYRSVIMPCLADDGADRFLLGAANYKVKDA
ncbi:MAG: hypothetical protein HOL37_01445 [Rhodospirillaceae bacterium]|jgi:hypothetical protein|nr:hypothetical protein [Rhodospirillaceae bacterium]MBT4463948.1 hypothetical protein [Rhodospirillaceae bacterium]MBT5014476.1 hypothetical protein [Rhodospirillaceae bacterium]MBT5307976.1 hypothetical protein [Rhodospirillaceae bacterium]MBT7355321.1 hypothetical protein [Rhodospirillaceae bacterium]